MTYKANIIYFSKRSDAEKIAEKLKSLGIDPQLFPIKKCVITDDISDYFVFDRTQASSLEKNYARDGKLKQSALVSIQKIVLDRLLERTDAEGLFFIEENFSPESFYIKKTLFRYGTGFFSFGRIASDSGITIVKGALDPGFHEASFLYPKNLNGTVFQPKIPVFPEFNGKIAIDAPPDSIPARYLRFFRSPLLMTRGLIRFFNGSEPRKRHGKIYVYSPEQASDTYTSSERTAQFIKFLGKRGKSFSDFSELPPKTTVLTWSTKRFFSLWKNGLRPIPATKSLAAQMFRQKIKSIGELVTLMPDSEKIIKVRNFLQMSELENFDPGLR